MIKAPLPTNEKERLESLKNMGILDSQPEERFDKYTKEAAFRLHVPISTISIIDADREWYKSCFGIKDKEGRRDVSFCGHAMLNREIFIVENTLEDERFKDNPAVVGAPFIRFYAGISLHNSDGFPIGVFCVKDFAPRKLTDGDIATLVDLATKVERELNSRNRFFC
ncbi:MAG: hypothetical protein A3H57_02200 [Candidatus Taylorbacteria bacterium RIFCSPLOWO2_02_FULL_43_11]|uniref:Uncharacterized protein n=1 Tax=Candidatus Taylorbacteria bacterium RIFCSPHIGHO2_02_FULL_43_32b TaxID=1802306 RepID=A0A1G2MDQ9_9BACT|nr:MAG: hypothetical protein A2743_02330 [Candidatus Taylorbacteria bacterium RIFCSPHIGHO2_01_FULL_43_47]OHA22018.1 MAG: hypothetical protein A3C72_01990 [Candidatus Taylorbacteria bacterium RIFCSPHIGHO2_02_FULL_43_32b]OHA28758.1 MAG: hypothetical protein A3B08_01165 [Candidatus Taylorbacteria bacterium RIFCSPLOWO2_01_FULL_43_44]OHA35489.1 MAG: hypothetical protein A3H57_02200 [Candidatus Taylorbacteria bacterium RIFCSPLOWO2_02_FULL_43_11]